MTSWLSCTCHATHRYICIYKSCVMQKFCAFAVWPTQPPLLYYQNKKRSRFHAFVFISYRYQVGLYNPINPIRNTRHPHKISHFVQANNMKWKHTEPERKKHSIPKWFYKSLIRKLKLNSSKIFQWTFLFHLCLIQKHKHTHIHRDSTAVI